MAAPGCGRSPTEPLRTHSGHGQETGPSSAECLPQRARSGDRPEQRGSHCVPCHSGHGQEIGPSSAECLLCTGAALVRAVDNAVDTAVDKPRLAHSHTVAANRLAASGRRAVTAGHTTSWGQCIPGPSPGGDEVPAVHSAPNRLMLQLSTYHPRPTVSPSAGDSASGGTSTGCRGQIWEQAPTNDALIHISPAPTTTTKTILLLLTRDSSILPKRQTQRGEADAGRVARCP